MRTPIDRQTTGDEQSGAPMAAEYHAGAMLAGKYRLEALLGEGGMGAVWRATNIALDLPVAIKLIRTGLDQSALRARLKLEARSAAKLGHPAIVRVYDVGESELAEPFIVMEHLSGETLAQQLLSQGRLPAVRAAQLLLPIIDALAMAHGRGIVHRDLKPDNLMIAREDQHICPKILDFGIAKLTDPRDPDHKLTEAGAVVGSPEYMSPEQARGQEDVGASTDIWSMCVVLYEAVTGCPPFTASNYNALLRSIVEDDPKPLSEHALGDGELWQILLRGLAKDRAQRYAKISELGQALAGWLVRQGVTEDACGSSLDSKWFGRTNHALISVQAAVVCPPSQPPDARPTEDSNPGSTGIARGPFSATIRPVASARARGSRPTQAVSGAVDFAFFSVALLALFHSARASAPIARPAGTSASSAAAAAPWLTQPARFEPPARASIAKIEVWPAGTAQSEPETKPTAAVTRVTKPSSSAARASTRITAVAPSEPPAAPTRDRALDLLAPY